MSMTINAKIRCYLTAPANDALNLLLQSGIADEDLALAVLEKIWPEDKIFNMDDEL
jgi:hypothetical protein